MTDDRVLASPGFLAAAREVMAATGGGAAFHLRGPRTSGRRLWEIGSALRPGARREGVTFLVNDRVDLALVLEADGAHLGERSLRTADARAILGPGALLGCSVHDAPGAGSAGEGAVSGAGADFLVAGPVFATPSHPGRSGIGPEGLGRIVTAGRGIPVVAIGGITAKTIPAVLGAGAHGVAVVRSAWESVAVRNAVLKLMRELGGTEEGS